MRPSENAAGGESEQRRPPGPRGRRAAWKTTREKKKPPICQTRPLEHFWNPNRRPRLPAPLRVNQWHWLRYVGPLAEITKGSSEAQRLPADSVGVAYRQRNNISEVPSSARVARRTGSNALQGEFLGGTRLMALYRCTSARLISPWPFSVNAVC